MSACEGEMAEICREFGISRKPGYKIFTRYNDCGLEGLTDRSRRPYRQANRLPFQLEKLIVSLKGEHPSWGAPNINRQMGVLPIVLGSLSRTLSHRFCQEFLNGSRSLEICSEIKRCISRTISNAWIRATAQQLFNHWSDFLPRSCPNSLVKSRIGAPATEHVWINTPGQHQLQYAGIASPDCAFHSKLKYGLSRFPTLIDVSVRIFQETGALDITHCKHVFKSRKARVLINEVWVRPVLKQQLQRR
jgi:hypothetical protein